MLFYRLIVFNGRGKLRSPLSAHRNAPSGHSGVSHGLFMISHHRPCGRWCFARLIRQAETLELQLHSQPPSKRTALSPLKRSCSRFASLTLRWRTEPAFQAVLVFRMAYLPYLTAFRMQAKQIQRLPLRGAGAKRLKGGPLGIGARGRGPQAPSPVCTRPAAAQQNCTRQDRVSPPEGCRGTRRFPDFIPQRRPARREDRFFHSPIHWAAEKSFPFFSGLCRPSGGAGRKRSAALPLPVRARRESGLPQGAQKGTGHSSRAFLHALRDDYTGCVEPSSTVESMPFCFA